MKTCSDGHENADDADRCVVCGKILPGNKWANATGSQKDLSEESLDARARRWVEGYGLVWEDLNFAEKDIFKRANKANATVAMIEMAQLKAGKIKGEALYEPKPKSGSEQPGENIVVQLTAASVAELKKSLKVLEDLANA
jgi:hypothetical protein